MAPRSLTFAASLASILAASALAASCKRADQSGSTAGGAGKMVAPGVAAALKASPDGAFVAWLAGCVKAPTGLVALGTQSCELRVAPTGGGEAMVVAPNVTTLPHGFVWADDGTLLALADYEHAAGEGTLVVWESASRASRAVAERVRFYAATSDGAVLGWVSGGVLSVLDRSGGAATRPEVLGERIATFEFAPAAQPRDAVRLLARRESNAGGELLALTSGKLTQVAPRTAEYRFSPAGDFAYTVRQASGDALAFARAAAPVAAIPVRGNVHSFTFAPDGSAIAFIADVAPGKQGDLWVARVAGEGARPGAPQRIASGVGEVRWAPRGGALAWLADFEPGMRSGALTVLPAGGASVRLAPKVSAYEFAPDGSAIAFLEHVVQGGYSVDLKLARLDDLARGGGALAPGGGAAARQAAAGTSGASTPADDDAPYIQLIERGAFGFDFAPEGDFLYFRAGCVQNGESCNLERVPAAGLAPGEKAERLAEAVKSFDFDRRTPGRLLLAVQRPDGTPVGIAVWRAGKLTTVDRGFVAGTAAFLGPDSGRLAYAVLEKGREGVYVATLSP